MHLQQIISSNIAVKLMNEGRVNACPKKYDDYCFNGGTCWIVEVFEEVSCK